MLNKNSIRLENKIVDQVYRLEKRRTIKQIAVYLLALGGLLLFSAITLQTLVGILQAQKTLDVFELFSEDFEIISEFLFDTLYVVYLESPKNLIFILFLSIVVFLLTLYLMIKNAGKIKNRLKAIYAYFRKGGE